MKKIRTLLLLIASTVYTSQATSQVPTAEELVGIHTVTKAQMNTISSPIKGTLLFNSDDSSLYTYNGSSWEGINPQGDETKIIADDNVTIKGSGTKADPYVISSIRPTLINNNDGTYTFSNGIDPDVIITGSGGGGNVPLVTESDSNGGCYDQFQTNETKDVVIKGEYFDGNTKVDISGQTVNSVKVNSSTQLTANVTAGSTTGDFDIQVITNGGTGTLSNGFGIKGALTTHTYANGEITLSNNMTYSSGVLKKNSGNGGWNGHGYSTLYGIPAGAEGHLSFTESHKGHKMIGLDNSPAASASYSKIDYALYLIGDGRIYIYENGRSRGNHGKHKAGDSFKINVDCDGKVTYHKNGSVIYTSPARNTKTLYLDSSFNQSAGKISNISIAY